MLAEYRAPTQEREKSRRVLTKSAQTRLNDPTTFDLTGEGRRELLGSLRFWDRMAWILVFQAGESTEGNVSPEGQV